MTERRFETFYVHAPLKLAASRESKREFSGYASVFNSRIDSVMGPTEIDPGSFTKTIRERRDKVPILRGHDLDKVIGQSVDLREDSYGLFMRARLAETLDGQEALTLIQDGMLSGLSIGFDTIHSRTKEDEYGTMVRHVTEARLWEISVVTFGADSRALIGGENSVDALAFYEAQYAHLAKELRYLEYHTAQIRMAEASERAEFAQWKTAHTSELGAFVREYAELERLVR